MQVTELSLKNFRNFQAVDSVELPMNALLVAAAPNATGKTSFLEAITVLLRGRSWRAGLPECVAWNQAGFELSGVCSLKEGDTTRLTVRYDAGQKKIKIEEDGAPVSAVTFYANYPFVLFLPEDVFLFSRGPAVRRTFLNHILVSSSSYVAALVQYQRVLRQRNAALKRRDLPAGAQAWDEALIAQAHVIWKQREALIHSLNSQVAEMYSKLSGEKGRGFEVRLTSTVESFDQLESALRDDFEKDVRFGYTNHGPHRDDVEVLVDGRPVTAVLSQGQTRSFVVALKVIAQQYIRSVTGQEPMLLLDEVLSEMDEKRQEALLLNLPTDGQVLLTCTSIPESVRSRDNAHLLDLRTITE